MFCKVVTRCLLAAVAVLGLASVAQADLLTKDSADFSYKTEMDSLPGSPDWGVYVTSGPSLSPAAY